MTPVGRISSFSLKRVDAGPECIGYRVVLLMISRHGAAGRMNNNLNQTDIARKRVMKGQSKEPPKRKATAVTCLNILSYIQLTDV